MKSTFFFKKSIEKIEREYYRVHVYTSKCISRYYIFHREKFYAIRVNREIKFVLKGKYIDFYYLFFYHSIGAFASTDDPTLG